MKYTYMLLTCAIAVAISGCRSHQLANDQDHIRTAVMQLHENQIMDNLVRARKGLPILHLDYSNMTGTVTQTGTGTASGTQTVASNRYLALGTAAAIARTFTSVGSLSATGTQVNQLTITAQPVTNSPEVYTAYLAFLKDADHLRESPCPPNCDEALLVRSYEGNCDAGGCGHSFWRTCWLLGGGGTNCRMKTYFYVPRQYTDEFRKLALFAVAVRGQPVPVSPNFEATVLGIVKIQKVEEADDKNFELFLKINRKIPNDTGYVVATINGRLYEAPDFLTILINNEGGLKRAQPGTVLEADQQTDVVRISANLKTLELAKIDDLVKGLANQKVGFRLKNFIPAGNPTDQALQDIRMQTELLRLGQFQSAP